MKKTGNQKKMKRKENTKSDKASKSRKIEPNKNKQTKTVN